MRSIFSISFLTTHSRSGSPLQTIRGPVRSSASTATAVPVSTAFSPSEELFALGEHKQASRVPLKPPANGPWSYSFHILLALAVSPDK
jgi:hypothetical protein